MAEAKAVAGNGAVNKAAREAGDEAKSEKEAAAKAAVLVAVAEDEAAAKRTDAEESRRVQNPMASNLVESVDEVM